jgi:hypothetical protein
MPSPRKPILAADPAAADAFIKGEPAAVPGRLTPNRSEPTVRFTVDLPRSLHKRLQLAAVEQQQRMTQLAREALTQWLDSKGC